MATNLKTDVVIIGAGVVGLAVAFKLSNNRRKVVVIEKNSQFGQETSSRNSEVVHSGIYYPKDSNKTNLCIEGREALYSFCERFNVPHLKCGKYVVTTDVLEENYIEQLTKHCKTIGIRNSRLSGAEIKNREWLVDAQNGLFFPESGIVDSHLFMKRLEQLASEQGSVFVYSHRVESIEHVSGGWIISLQNPKGEIDQISSDFVVNAAGLSAAEISNKTLGVQRYEHRFCRGRYFNLTPKFINSFKSLIYPIPDGDGLGIHVTRDLGGMIRLGPDVDWLHDSQIGKLDSMYDCDWDLLKPRFLKSVQRYLPNLEIRDLSPGLVGIRPKLFLDGQPYHDFLLENQRGFVQLLGMESPGLTASLAIAKAVEKLL